MKIHKPSGAFFKPILMRFTNYLKDVRGEMKHVSWPTRRQALVFTALVIAISVFGALYLGLLDFIFSAVLGRVV